MNLNLEFMMEELLRFKNKENATHINRSLTEINESTEKVPNIPCGGNLDIKITKKFWVIF